VAVTLHWMDAGLDTGAVACVAEFPIAEDDTGLSVFTNCLRYGVPLVLALLQQASRDPAGIPRLRQSGPRTLYRHRDVQQEGRLEWGRTAREVHDFARACDFGLFPSRGAPPRTRLGDRQLGVAGTARTREPCDVPAGTVGEPRAPAATVATADEWLAVRRVVVDGRRVPAPESSDQVT
jgi:methionyl-tRNA formyltransferase